MGEFANDIQSRLSNQLAEKLPSFDWVTENQVGDTPVDLVGRKGDQLVLIELEWRRADPSDNTAKLFRHLSTTDPPATDITVIQLFTQKYDLESGGVSSKRENAEFVGHIAADALDNLAYLSLDFNLDPPKAGGDLPEDWRQVTDSMVIAIEEAIE